jgi:RsiW-degrading membrane proteinase PrsW (M82 family)
VEPLREFSTIQPWARGLRDQLHREVDMTVLVPATRTRRHGWWWKALLVGLGLWAATIAVTAVTLNSNLVPTLILLGSFLVPFCVVLFAAERITGNVTGTEVMLAFVVGGLFGVLGATLLEVNLRPTAWTYLGVGFIEEFVKAVILVAIGFRVVPKNARQGALLGATVGAGFAAFESAGYAFNASLTPGGIDLVSILQTEVLRSILTPVGHVLWTAIVGAVLFGAAREKSRYRMTFGVILALVGASLLHGLWDSMSGIASFLALLVTGNIDPLVRFGFLRPGSSEVVSALASTYYVVGLIIVSVIGMLALWLVVRRHRSRGQGPADDQPDGSHSYAL